MFKRGWLLHRDRIYSSEGFFVIAGKDWLVYSEGDRRMTITVEGEVTGLLYTMRPSDAGTTAQ